MQSFKQEYKPVTISATPVFVDPVPQPIRSNDEISACSVPAPSSSSNNKSNPSLESLAARQRVLKPVRFDEETVNLSCEWENCLYTTTVTNDFAEHVSTHIPGVEVVAPVEFHNYEEVNPGQTFSVCLICKWFGCSFKALLSVDLQRHLYLHAYHTRLKCIGSNTSARCNLNKCNGNDLHRNTLPDLTDNLRCAWATCADRFVNIQEYYDHIRYHCEDERGKSHVIRCRWAGCKSTVANVTKLKDHMRSHTQEKLLACPACGSLFSNRTRYFDHCRRQILVGMDSQLFTCEICCKCFPTARLFREHVRSHDNKYPCPKCKMSCASPSTLANHMTYKHSKERPYKCPYCSYTAKVPSDITKHSVVHDNSMLRCEESTCSYSCKSQVNLQSHMDKVHNSLRDSKYSCHLCDNKYFKGAYLSKHLMTVHKLQWPPGHSRFKYRLWGDGLYRLNSNEVNQVNQAFQNAAAAEAIDIKHHV